MQRYPGWEHTADNQLKCPAGKTTKLKRQVVGSDGTTTLILFMGPRDCRGCPLLRGCTKSTNPMFRKEVMLTLSPLIQPAPADCVAGHAAVALHA